MNIAITAAIALRVLNIAIAAAIALRVLLHECYRCCYCMNIIFATAIALRVKLHEDYIYHMPVTTTITASVKAYISQTSIGQYAILPKYLATMAYSDPNLIPSVAQFHLWLLHEYYYCCMYIMAPVQTILSPLHETLLLPYKCNYCCELEGATIARPTESAETSRVLCGALAAA